MKTGKNPSDAELKEIMVKIDIDGNGTIEFNEFIQLMIEQKTNKIDKILGSAFDDIISLATTDFDAKILNQSM